MSQKNENEIAFHVSQLSVNYDKTPVLWDVSLAIPKGNLVGIVGPNGAGKSTLIKTALGLVKPLSGGISFFGKSLEKVRTKIGYVPQRESVDWDFPITVSELVLMGCYGYLGILKRPSKEERKKAEKMLDLVGMLPYATRQISQLSGGQQQRVFLARALMQNADLYFMDEPFSGIDAMSGKVIMDLLSKLKDEGKTVIVVHHDLASVKECFNWVIMLNMRLVASGPVATTFTHEMLERTFGLGVGPFDEAQLLSQAKTSGFTSF